MCKNIFNFANVECVCVYVYSIQFSLFSYLYTHVKKLCRCNIYKRTISEDEHSLFLPLGVPLIPRKMVAASNPVVEVSRDGDTWTIRMNTLVRTVEYIFVPGQTMETETMGGLAQVGDDGGPKTKRD